PDADLDKAGQEIVVISRGNPSISGTIARIEVRKDAGEVAALDADGNELATYPATIGSGEFPSPSGNMTVSAVAPEANYTFDPDDQKWGPDKTFVIPPGPNNPIGGVWIDLGKDGYGIHGSPDPQLIGKTTSHGCVRLTNWDARTLADAVSQGVEVEFV
ncbi:MAG: L,D-transpeptidase, partial [Alteraurantiacibacter sp.]